MSEPNRDVLVKQIVLSQHSLAPPVRDLSSDLTAGSRDLVPFRSQRWFEALWDAARKDISSLHERPLFALWRQSVELAIKAAIIELASAICGQSGSQPRKTVRATARFSFARRLL